VPEAVRVDVGDAALRGAGVQHVAGAVEVIGALAGQQPWTATYGCSARTRRNGPRPELSWRRRARRGREPLPVT
jgi:hypothetical protein